MAEVSSNNGNPESYSLPSDVDPWKPIFGEFQSEGTCTTSSQGFDNNFADSFSENLCVHVQNGSQTQQHCPLPDSEVYLASLERRLQKIKGRSRNLTSHDLISGLERARQDCLAELLGHTDDSEPFYEEDIDGALIQLRRRLQPESVALSAEELQYLLHARKSSSSSLGKDAEPTEDNFELSVHKLPSVLATGWVMVRTLCLSVDPYMRCQMNADTGADYLRPWKLGKAIEGTGIGLVEQSEFEGLAPGDIVRSFTWPWQLRSTLPGASLNKIDPAIVGGHVSHFLGAVGLSGLTALLGIRVKGHIRQNANQTVLISGAAGSCGHLAGQIARLEGAATVVGICGSEEKCRVLVEELGFDGAINYKKKNVEAELQSCCPRGIDVYFDNVGGDISNSVIRQMNEGGHIVLCGQISQYNKDVPYPPPLLNDIEQVLHQRSITRERFLVLHYQERFAESVAQLAAWLADGKLKVRETVEHGLSKAGAAFVSMMRGGNIGKQIVTIADL